MAKVIQRRSLTLLERSYLWEIIKGMGTTFKHLFRNFKNPEKMQLMSYPEVEVQTPQNYRGSHRLMKRPDGEPRCVACYMCSTACPARCITIEAEPSSDPRIEKKPRKFEIDWLVCVFCGLCEEACPVDAIRMDTRKVAISHYTRKEFIADMPRLLNWDPKDFPANDAQSQKAPGGKQNQQAKQIWGLEVKHS
jgi:NADH-quinone oxidoreductase subunit I